jgi:electron transport complex protein RnfG
MTGTPNTILRSGFLLAAVALLGTSLLVAVNNLTHERILAEEKARALEQLGQIVPTVRFDNDLLEDIVHVTDPEHFRHDRPVTIHRVRLDGRPVAAIMATTAPDGYNGDIRLLTGIDAGGKVLGVRVVSHKETPGLGDPIEIEKSDWVLGFTGKSLDDPARSGWKVERDGGLFDQFTGATITPRAVVRAVHDALTYFEANADRIFAPADNRGSIDG